MRTWTEKDRDTNRTVHRADFTCAGRRHKPKASSREELFDIIEAIRRRARAAKYGLEIEPEAVSLHNLVVERKKDYTVKDRKQRRQMKILDLFEEHLGADREVRTIKSMDMRSFVQSLRLRNPKLSSSSVNHYLNRVNAMLHKAQQFFPSLENWTLPRMPFEKVSKRGRARVITEEEIARLFYSLRAPRVTTAGEKHKRREQDCEVSARHTAADIFEISLMTGMRLTEVRTLTISRIDWTVRQYGDHTIYGFIQLPPRVTKTREPRRVPLNFDARQILERRAREHDCKWLFPNSAETGPISETTIRDALRSAARKAGVPYGRKVEDGFVFHDTRHTAATRMLEGGSHIKTVGQILGHTDATMTMRYSHVTGATLASAVSALSMSQKAHSNDGSLEGISREKGEDEE